MKATAAFVAILGLALLVLPMISLNMDLQRQEDAAQTAAEPDVPLAEEDPRGDSVDQKEAAAQEQQSLPEEEQPAEQPEGTEPPQREYELLETGVEFFRILDQSTGEIRQVSLQDYVRGAVASEMPVAFHEEALKAQAVAAHTYALYNHLEQQRNPDPALQGADFSADPSNRKGYMTKEKTLEFYGESGERSWTAICQAVDSVLPLVMVYEEEPIVAVYHAMSAGKTEDAGNVWVSRVPYLQPVESEGDYLAPDYETTTALSVEAVRDALLSRYPDLELPADPSEWFEEVERSESGYITAVAIGGKELHGSEVRTMFDLRSHNLDIRYTDSGFVFTAYGHGHGVGLSQYGADFLARQGYTFDEILSTYYTGISLRRVAVE